MTLNVDKKDKQIEQDLKSTVFLDCIQKQRGIPENDIYKHCFHYLLFHDKETIQSLTEGITQSIQNAGFNISSIIDKTRIQLQLVSLCTVSDEGLFSIKESLCEGISQASWAWTNEEKAQLQLRFKSQQKRETYEEPESTNNSTIHH